MVHLIDKDAVVAEIERRMDENSGKQSLPQYFGMIEEDLNILSFIDTLEVKEIDWEEEMQRQMNGARVDVTSFCQEVPEDIARVVVMVMRVTQQLGIWVYIKLNWTAMTSKTVRESSLLWVMSL